MNDCELTSATIITSRIGGNLRIRSYVNILMKRGGIKDPLIVPGLNAQYPTLLKTYEYDIQTQPGEKYPLHRARHKLTT